MRKTFAAGALAAALALAGIGPERTRVEIWDGPTWEAYLAEQESGYADTAEEVLPPFPF